MYMYVSRYIYKEIISEVANRVNESPLKSTNSWCRMRKTRDIHMYTYMYVLCSVPVDMYVQCTYIQMEMDRREYIIESLTFGTVRVK